VATLSDIRTQVARDLRDSSNNTWSTTELNDLINQGLDALADFYPLEIVSTFATVSSGVFSYSASSFTNVYRVDIYSSAGSYTGTLPAGIGDGPDSGWELHGGVIYLPPNWTLDAGSTLTAFGYGRYIQLSADTSTTDADTAGVNAVRIFCQAEAFGRLLADRAAFQQWQASPGNTDTTLLGLSQVAFSWRRRWQEEQRRLRRLRKLG
jgi:hypothetical protein